MLISRQVAPLSLGMLLGLVFSRLPGASPSLLLRPLTLLDETVAVGMQERLGLFTILLICFT